MKTCSVLPLLGAVSFALSACAPLRDSERTAERMPIVGGYSRSTDAKESSRVAAFAAREESRRTGMPIRVVQILKSDTQVVAGLRFRLRIAAQRNGASTETAEAIVFRDLAGRLHLTSWRWLAR
ncbi:MAG: hypothetical protein H0X73_01980 [Chthoniobacterales bacterium]|nr:hypothetical protein [Chthoniobacterales bacterium]